MYYFKSHCKFLCLSFEKISVKLYITFTNNTFVLISQFDILLIKKKREEYKGEPSLFNYHIIDKSIANQ